MITQVVLGMDIGGTSADYALIDNEGRILYKANISNKDYTTPSNLVQLVKSQTEQVLTKQKDNMVIRGIGIGAPNGNYYRGTIEFAPNMKWDGIIPLADYFRMAFGVPAYLTNDANAAAIGEHMFGNARNVKDFIIITLGTGLGSGIFANGQLVYGNDGFAGELGHILIDGNERMCGCGRKGCLETYASATGLKRTVVQLLDEKEIESSLYDVPVNTLSARMIEKAAREGDPLALEAFEITGKVLGKALANAVAFTSPALIVLFGGLSQARELLLNPTKREMEENLLRIYKSKVPIIFSGLPGNDAALLGAAALAWKELGVE